MPALSPAIPTPRIQITAGKCFVGEGRANSTIFGATISLFKFASAHRVNIVSACPRPYTLNLATLSSNNKGKHMRKRGIDLVCRRHGAEHLVIEDSADPKEYHVRCKGYGRRKRCAHHRYANGRQANELLSAYRNCDIRPNQKSAWDSLFERIE